MKIPKHAHKLYIVGGVVAIVVLAGGGLTWFGLRQSHAFEQAVETATEAVSDRIVAADNKLGQDKSPQNTDAVLQSLQSHLTDYKAPQPTNILGFRLASADAKHQAEELQNDTTMAAKTLKDSLALLHYQQAAAASLAKSNNLQATNADELKTVAAAYKATTSELIDLRPPARLADFHTKLTQASLAVSDGVAKLPELYIAQDVEGFKKQNAQVAADITALRELHNALLTELTSQDEALARALQLLR